MGDPTLIYKMEGGDGGRQPMTTSGFHMHTDTDIDTHTDTQTHRHTHLLIYILIHATHTF